MKDKRGFELAKHASEFSDYKKNGIHIGAVIVRKNKVLGIGWNQNKSHPIQYEYNKYRFNDTEREYDRTTQTNSIHAEISAIKDALRRNPSEDLSKCDIYIYRTNLGMCCPCEACAKVLKENNIKKIHYTNNGYVNERRVYENNIK